MYPLLQESYKGKYPFRLSVPSFIYPADYVTNVNILAPFVDEVELLFFDSLYEGSLPSYEEFIKLAEISHKENILYNVHLPVDISISDSKPLIRTDAANMIKNVFNKADELYPTTWTLHVSYDGVLNDTNHCKKWKKSAYSGIEQILSGGINSRKISIETLDYPFEWLDEIIEKFDLSVCLDTGHLLRDEVNPMHLYEKYLDRVSILHIHGVKNGRDHLSLDNLEDTWVSWLKEILSSFTGTVSIEVFSYDSLVRSLKYLEILMT